MADTLGPSRDKAMRASTIDNSYAAVAVLLVALTPQIFELAWSIGGLLFRYSGRSPPQVLFDHGSALLLAGARPPLGSLVPCANTPPRFETLLPLDCSLPYLVP